VSIPAGILASCRTLAAATPGLELLILHGSRARGQARPDSDWDFAFAAAATFDPDDFLGRLVETLGADRVDLADLSRAGALLRFRVAQDGVVIFERQLGAFERFWFDAVHTWCDLAPVLLPVYEHRLQSLRP
jgi:predicted nucleotidyltransferase